MPFYQQSWALSKKHRKSSCPPGSDHARWLQRLLAGTRLPHRAQGCHTSTVFSNLFQGLAWQKTGPESAVAVSVQISSQAAPQPPPHPVAEEGSLHGAAEGVAAGTSPLHGRCVKIHWRKPQSLTSKNVFLENMTILVCYSELGKMDRLSN